MSFQNAQVIGTNVNPDVYHAQTAERGNANFVMSPSSLKAFAECPRRWIDGYEPPQTKAKDWGSVLDCLVLTPREFPLRYAVLPETYPAPAHHADVKSGKIAEGHALKWNGNAAYCRAWLEERQKAGCEVISLEVGVQCENAASRLAGDEILAAFLAASDKQVLVTGQWQDKATGLVIPVRCLIDLVPKANSEFAQCLGDLKSTRSACPTRWSRFAYQMGYHVQGSFDLDLFNAATGEERDTWCFILVENFAPFTVGREILSQRFRDVGRMQYEKTLALYAQCVKTDQWPSYDDHAEAVQGWTVMQPESWMEMAALDQRFSLSEAAIEPEPELSEMPS